MRKSHIAAAVAVVLCAAGFTSVAHANECQFDRSLSVGASPVLMVTTGSGDVKITTGNDNSIRIHGRVRSNHGMFGGEGDVQAVCDHPPIEQNGNDVRIGKQHEDMYRHVSIDYTVETPRATDLNASTGSGNLDIADISGHVSGSTGSGDIRAQHLPADSKLETGSGDIHLALTAAGDVHVGTGSGNIEITGLNGGLKAGTGSGWIHVTGAPASDWKLETGSGDVRLNMEGGKGYELDAESSSGDVHVDQPITMQGSLSKHHVHGTVGGGGSLIRVSTGSGDIELH